jgi:5-methylcytosine-specific restriction endonuclease McrA
MGDDMSLTPRTLLGGGYTEAEKRAIWSKGHPIVNYDPAVWRRDRFGYAMRFSDHGDRSSQYGWEVDHVVPSALGGHDGFQNLQPTHWKMNTAKGHRGIG